MEQATIPIVDDGPHVLVLLEAVLAADLRVLRAGASPTTLKLLRTEHDVAVIATDYKMPPMTGVEGRVRGRRHAYRADRLQRRRQPPMKAINTRKVFQRGAWLGGQGIRGIRGRSAMAPAQDPAPSKGGTCGRSHNRHQGMRAEDSRLDESLRASEPNVAESQVCPAGVLRATSRESVTCGIR